MSTLISTGFHLPYNPELVAKAREMRSNPTSAEDKLWRLCLRGLKPPFYRQRPIDYFIVDFYCPALKLVIEVDGDSHFDQRGVIYDQERTAALESYGLKIVRFTNRDIEQNFDGVRQVIYDVLHGYPLHPPLIKGERRASG